MKYIGNLISWLKRNVFNFIGRYLKTCGQSNNPQLTILMNEKLTFRELKEKEIELKEMRLKLIASQSSMDFSKRWYKKDYNQEDFDKISDEIYQIDDLLKGIEFKISEVGYEYEYVIQTPLPNDKDEMQTWTSIKTIILGKEYSEKLSESELIEFMIAINIKLGESIKSIRRIKKNR